MKRSEMIQQIEDSMWLWDEVYDTKDGLAEHLLTKIENFGMRPPEWTEFNKSKGAGGAWAARRRGDWENEAE